MRFAYANEDEFVKTYCYYCEQEAVFAPTEKVIPPNSECAFSLELTDGSPMLRGLGVVLDCWTTDDNRFGRRGVYIGFSQLTTTSEAIHARMQALRKLEEEENTDVTQIPVMPRSRNAPQTQQQWGAQQRSRTAQIAAPEVEETDAGEMQKSITEEMQAASASGLLAIGVPQPIEEKTSNTSRYEGVMRGPAIPAKRVERAASESPSTSPEIPSQRASSPMPGLTLPRTVTPIGAVKLARVPASQARPGTGAAAAVASPAATPAASATAGPLARTDAPPERGSAPALPPIPVPAARPVTGASPTPPPQMPRGSSPPQSLEADAAAASVTTSPPAAITPPSESAIPTEPIRVSGSWEDRIAQIRERAADAAQKAWRRAQTTAAQGLQVVRTEANQWKADPRTAAQRWKPTRKAVVVFASGILFGLILALFIRSKPPAPKTAAAAPSHPNRIAALFQQPPAAKCTDSKADEAIATLETPPPIVLPTSKSPHAKTKVAVATPKQPTTKVATTKQPTPAATKAPATAKTTQPTTVAKTTQPTTAKTTQPATVAKTTQPTTPKTTQPTTVAKTTQPTTVAKTTQPTTKTTQPSTKTQSTAVAKTAAKTSQPALATTLQPTAKTTAKTAPVQAKTAPATKAPTPKKTGKAACTGLDCI
ncbi:MAG TPA: hypothetical protein VL326_32175 [Kofleriaceae bacterium]|nr:hypothetical protein [Kofleriaceae bacterium]